jgi:predicted acetyltransferase
MENKHISYTLYDHSNGQVTVAYIIYSVDATNAVLELVCMMPIRAKDLQWKKLKSLNSPLKKTSIK